MNRRTMLKNMTALAAVMTLPSVSQAEAVAEVVPVAPPPPVNPRRWGWGFWQNGDEMVHGPYSSREEAIEAAKEHYEFDLDDNGKVSFDTAEWDRMPVHHGDYHEDIINAMCEGLGSLAWVLQSSMENSNCDNDWEGEVGEAIADVDWKALAELTWPLIYAAIERSGHFVWGDITEIEFDPDTGLIPALDADNIFKADIKRVLHPVIEATGVMESSCMLDNYNDETHHVTLET